MNQQQPPGGRLSKRRCPAGEGRRPYAGLCYRGERRPEDIGMPLRHHAAGSQHRPQHKGERSPPAAEHDVLIPVEADQLHGSFSSLWKHRRIPCARATPAAFSAPPRELPAKEGVSRRCIPRKCSAPPIPPPSDRVPPARSRRTSRQEKRPLPRPRYLLT